MALALCGPCGLFCNEPAAPQQQQPSTLVDNHQVRHTLVTKLLLTNFPPVRALALRGSSRPFRHEPAAPQKQQARRAAALCH
jgi:hypothetical protein